MEMPQGSSPCSYLKQKCNYLLIFLYKIREQEGKTGPAWGDWYQFEGGRGGEMVKVDEYSANTLYTCM
jgi:hypothetical protein